jgi:hypothetical protein
VVAACLSVCPIAGQRAYHADVSVRERGEQYRRLVRTAAADLFDQRRPFGRLALTHVLMTAGDTMFAVSLAGSLFFSISPTAAQDKVLLYLVLTMAPFAVVAPALGPLIDRSRGARRGMVVVSALGRAILCPFLAQDIHSLLLFPEAFAMLVLSKVYLVTKGALVPEMAILGMLGPDATTGSATAPPGGSAGIGPSPGDPPSPTPPLRPAGVPVSPAHPPYGQPTSLGSDSPTGEGAAAGQGGVEPDLASLNARLGLLASLSGFVFALPAVLALKLGGAAWVLWLDLVVFLGAVVAGTRLPVRKRESRRERRRAARTGGVGSLPVSQSILDHPVDSEDEWSRDELDLAALRPIAAPPVLLALVPMSVLKALVGFLTFLFAFGLRRQGASTWWFGLLLGAITAGALIGVLLVARLRRVLSEQQILVASLWLVAAGTLVGALLGDRLIQVVVAVTVGVAGAVAKPSFDALVQRHVAESNQGRAFARFETQLQLVWVVGAFIPVVLTLPIPGGDVVMAVTAVVGALTYMSSLRAAARPVHHGHPPHSRRRS